MKGRNDGTKNVRKKKEREGEKRIEKMEKGRR